MKTISESELFATQVIEGAELSVVKPKGEMEVLRQFFGLELEEEEVAQLEYGSLTIEFDRVTGEPKKIFTASLGRQERMRHKLVAFLMARGFTNREIAEATGYNRETVSKISSMPHVRNLALGLMDKIAEKIGLDKELALSMLGGKSLEAAEEVLEIMTTAKNKSVRLRAAVKVLEALGLYDKKTQTSEDERKELVQLIINNNEKGAQTAVVMDGGKKKKNGPSKGAVGDGSED